MSFCFVLINFVQLQRVLDGGLRRFVIFIFFFKNSHFSASLITFRSFLKIFERALNCLNSEFMLKIKFPNPFSLPYLQVKPKTCLSASVRGLNAVRDLVEG